MASETPAWIQAVGAIAQAVIALGTMFLSWLFWQTTKRNAKVDYARQMAAAWNEFDALIVQDPSLVTSDASVLGDSADRGEPERVRQRYLTYMMLNIAAAAYAANGGKLMAHDDHMAEVRRIVDHILSFDQTAEVLYRGGYSPAFVAFCRRRHAAIKKGEQPPAE